MIWYHLHRPIANLSCFSKCASYYGIRIFNNLPQSITSLRNEKPQFKITLKNFLCTLLLLCGWIFVMYWHFIQWNICIYLVCFCMLLTCSTSNCLVTASGNYGMYVCIYVCMYVCIFLFYFLFIKYAPSPRNDTTYYSVTSYLFFVIGRGCRVCLCSRRRPLHFLYNV